jgi:hypothetical protein
VPVLRRLTTTWLLGDLLAVAACVALLARAM